MNATVPPNEAAQPEALRRYSIMDTALQRSFDDIANLAAFICCPPFAGIEVVIFGIAPLPNSDGGSGRAATRH